MTCTWDGSDSGLNLDGMDSDEGGMSDMGGGSDTGGMHIMGGIAMSMGGMGGGASVGCPFRRCLHPCVAVPGNLLDFYVGLASEAFYSDGIRFGILDNIMHDQFAYDIRRVCDEYDSDTKASQGLHPGGNVHDDDPYGCLPTHRGSRPRGFSV